VPPLSSPILRSLLLLLIAPPRLKWQTLPPRSNFRRNVEKVPGLAGDFSYSEFFKVCHDGQKKGVKFPALGIYAPEGFLFGEVLP
jgi:hypothetical protein